MNVDDVWPSSHRGPVSLQEWARFLVLKTRKAPEGALSLHPLSEGNGAGEGIRTLDPNLGKVVLYP